METFMNPKQDLTDIANQDWSKFDFTRWNLEGLNLDTQPATVAAWVRDARLSSQPAQAFARGMTAIKATVLKDLQSQVKQLKQGISAADAELSARTTATQNQIDALKEGMRAAALPPSACPEAESFQIAIKVVEQSSRMGLSGLEVRVFDAMNPKVTLACGTTDHAGNVVLTLSKDQAESLNKNNAEIDMEVLTRGHKSVLSGGHCLIPKLNHASTLVASIQNSADLSPHLDAANAVVAQQEALLNALDVKLDALKVHYKEAKDEAQQQLELVQAIIADLETTAP
jgi:hypothetical protein